MAHSQKLSDIQLHLLRFFSERQVSNEETDRNPAYDR